MSSDYRTKFVKDNLWVSTGVLFVYAKNIIVLPILVKNIGISTYGSYILLISILGLTYGISSLGIGFSYTRYMPSAVSMWDKQNLFYGQLFIRIIILFFISSIIIFLESVLKNNLFKGAGNFSIILACCYLFTNLFFSTIADYYRYTHRIKYFTIITTAFPYISLLLLIILIYYLKVSSINYLLLVDIIPMTLISIPFAVKLISELKLKFPSLKLNLIVKDVKLGFPLLLNYVVDYILDSSDRIIIAFFLTAAFVGYYSPAYTLGALIIMIPRIFGVVLPPTLSKLYDEGKNEEIIIITQYTIKIFLLFCIPYIIGGFILSKYLLTMFATKEVAANAYFVTPIVTLGILFYGLNIILSNILFITLKTRLLFKINFIASILNIILNIILFYLFMDIIIAAVTTLISYLVSFILINKNIYKYIHLRYDVWFTIKIVLAAVTMGVLISTVNYIVIVNAWYMICGIILLGIVLYITFCLLFKVLREDEIKTIKKLLFTS